MKWFDYLRIKNYLQKKIIKLICKEILDLIKKTRGQGQRDHQSEVTCAQAPWQQECGMVHEVKLDHCRAQKTRDLDVAETGELRVGQVWLIWSHSGPW